MIEAEAFEDVGGWVNDQQFMDLMGSPYLLAHGIGVPVEDGHVAAAGIDPDVEGIPTAPGSGGKIQLPGPGVVVEFEPEIGSVFLHNVRHASGEIGVDNRIPVRVFESGYRNAPGALA